MKDISVGRHGKSNYCIMQMLCSLNNRQICNILNSCSKRKPIDSVVAILTLEITGIPVDDPHRDFPWPKPEFIPKHSTRSNAQVFDVSVFASSESDFIFPLSLYLWRIKQIEEATSKHNKDLRGIAVADFYFDPDGVDAMFTKYDCKVVGTQKDRDRHFQESGFQSLIVEYPNGERSLASPWEISVANPSERCPLPSCLTRPQVDVLTRILDSLEEDLYIYNTFAVPVDTRRFVDYLSMIEVPMDISVIRKRLKEDYYTNVSSVKADMKLICDNCKKYNTSDCELSDEAEKMCTIFMKQCDEKLQESGHILSTGVRLEAKAENEKPNSEDEITSSIQETRRSTRNTTSEDRDSPNGRTENHYDGEESVESEVKLRVTLNRKRVTLSDGEESEEEYKDEGSSGGSYSEAYQSNSDPSDSDHDSYSASSVESRNRSIARKNVRNTRGNRSTDKRKNTVISDTIKPHPTRHYKEFDLDEDQPESHSFRRSTRSSRRSSVASIYQEESESNTSNGEWPSDRKKTPSNRRQQSLRMAKRRNDDDNNFDSQSRKRSTCNSPSVLENTDSIISPASTRAPRSGRRSNAPVVYKDDSNSDVDDLFNESESESESLQQPTTSRNSTKSSTRRSARNQSPRKATRVKTAYKDLSDSDIDDSALEDSGRRVKAKRQRQDSPSE